MSISNSVFTNVDFNLHNVWPHENLLENSSYNGTDGYGGYGYGVYFSTGSALHGNGGPRNVMYNNDIRSKWNSIDLRGANEAPMFLYNRFHASFDTPRSNHWSGVPGVYGAEFTSGVFDAILAYNTFILNNTASLPLPMVKLSATSDANPGIEVVGNKVYGGSGVIVSGGTTPLINSDNTAFPYPGNPATVPRPSPMEPSLFPGNAPSLLGTP